MAPSTPPLDTYIVIDNGDYGEDPTNISDNSSNNKSSNTSTTTTITAANSNNKSNNSPFSGIEPSMVGAAATAGPFAGFQRLLDRNPTKVINGRYTISFRQLLILIVIILTIPVLWFFTGGSYNFNMREAFNKQLERQRAHSNNTPHVQNGLQSVVAGIAPLNAVAQDRHDRVRGKGARTGLKQIQFDFPMESKEEREEREQRLNQVRAGMAHAWAGYKKHAWGHDEVKPVSGGYKDNFGGWGATMIDSLDTLVIMGFNKEFDEALEWVKTSFDMTRKPTDQLQFFETVIRYLGGLLSTYDLTGEKVLLDKAEELGNYCLNAFTNRVFPNGRFAVQKNANYRGSSFILAEVGTIQLEFTRLSTLTGNPIYKDKALAIFDTLDTANAGIPGVLPFFVSEAENAPYSYYTGSIGGMADSYYEYILKEWIILDGKAPKYRKMFEKAIQSVSDFMVTRPDDGNQNVALIGLTESSDKSIKAEMEHLGCFMGGSLAMGSKYFDRPGDMALAKQLTELCYQTYHHSETGLGPETIKFELVSGTNGKRFKVNPTTFYDRRSSRNLYILRPETLESLWILYRITGEKKYQDQAWEIFLALERSCRTDIAYASLHDVNKIGSHDNRMESFFLAETMKYLYLIFSTPDVISLDHFVLNTEAHPILRQ
ncbi:hypothetical protein BG004_001993 [Podila humilis]|nr:hypothetical protein BG004_001993 [Podila humilis]